MRRNSSDLHWPRQADEIPSECHVSKLPYLVWICILKLLDGKSLLTLRCVNKMLNQLVSSCKDAWVNACRRSGLIVREDETNKDAVYFMSFYLKMTTRKRLMKNGSCFKARRSYLAGEKHSSSLMYYHNGKVAVSTSCRPYGIQIWNCYTDICERIFPHDEMVLSVKFDDKILVWYDGGNKGLKSWNIVSGDELKEYAKNYGVESYDSLSDCRVLAVASSDDCVRIYDITKGDQLHLFQKLPSFTFIQVMLAQIVDEVPQQHTIGIFMLTEDTLYIWKGLVPKESTSFSSAVKMEWMRNLSLPHSTLTKRFGFTGVGSLCCDGRYLFFSNVSPSDLTNVVRKFDVIRNRDVSEISMGQTVCRLHAVGKYYMVFSTMNEVKLKELLVVEKDSFNIVARCEVISSMCWNNMPWYEYLYLGDRSWLDGLDGKNDNGIFYLLFDSTNAMQMAEWIPRNENFP